MRKYGDGYNWRMLNKHIVSSNHIICSDLNTTNLENASEKYGITITTDNNEVAKMLIF